MLPMFLGKFAFTSGHGAKVYFGYTGTKLFFLLMAWNPSRNHVKLPSKKSPPCPQRIVLISIKIIALIMHGLQMEWHYLCSHALRWNTIARTALPASQQAVFQGRLIQLYTWLQLPAVISNLLRFYGCLSGENNRRREKCNHQWIISL